MCDWCETEATKAFCQDCGTFICQDAEPDDEWPAALFVTSYGDCYCWRCGMREQHDIDEMEEAEADEWAWMDVDPYDTGHYDETDGFDLVE